MFKHIRINGESRIVFEYNGHVEMMEDLSNNTLTGSRKWLVAAVMTGGIK